MKRGLSIKSAIIVESFDTDTHSVTCTFLAVKQTYFSRLVAQNQGISF